MKQPHILCDETDVGSRVILPGDPGRVERIASFLENPREVAYNREFRTVTGSYRGKTVTVTSTGIGGASLVIALEELIRCGGRTFIRTGSCGACREGIRLGDLILSSGAVREEGASRMYLPPEYPAVPHSGLLARAETLCRKEGYPVHTGITRSHDSFYIDDEAERMEFWSRRGVLASDMETATLYVLASLRGVRALSILNNVVLFRGDLREGIGDYVQQQGDAELGEQREIRLALEVLVSPEGETPA